MVAYMELVLVILLMDVPVYMELAYMVLVLEAMAVVMAILIPEQEFMADTV